MVELQLLILRVPGSIPDIGVCGFFHFCQNFTPNFLSSFPSTLCPRNSCHHLTLQLNPALSTVLNSKITGRLEQGGQHTKITLIRISSHDSSRQPLFFGTRCLLLSCLPHHLPLSCTRQILALSLILFPLVCMSSSLSGSQEASLHWTSPFDV